MTRSGCVSKDTQPNPHCGRAVLALLVAALAFSSSAHAEPRELAASVVWTRADLIYVAAPDSGTLVAGMALSVGRGKRELASATVTQLLEPRLAVARVGSGSLAREKRLDKLRVRGEAPSLPRLAVLRVGLPGRGRANLLFACSAAGVATNLGPIDYRVDSLAAGRFRLVRDLAGEAPLAPDTLLVRLFADAADQEIALERGELDVAVFWPGELSARMRADSRWRDAPHGLRARGVLAGIAAAGDTLSAPVAELAAVNRDVFADDLLAWSELEPDDPGAALPPARWIVDAALPGSRVIERVLSRTATGPGARNLRLAYLDVPLAAHDAAQASWRTRGVTPAFALRCPVLAAAGARELVRALGADAFANLATCSGNRP